MKVKRLESEHRLAVREAERKLKAAEGKPLAALEKASDFFGPSLKVYPDRVETPKGSHSLTTDLSARVEGSGRSLVVLIEGSDWGYTHDPHPDDTNKAHDFAREFNRIIKTLPIEDSDAVKTARATLEQVRKDQSKIQERRPNCVSWRRRRPPDEPDDDQTEGPPAVTDTAKFRVAHVAQDDPE